MTASYPTAIKEFTAKRNNVDYVDSSHINEIQEEINAIETFVGVQSEGALVKETKTQTLTNKDLTDSSNTIPVATSSEINAGTDTKKAIPVDQFVASNRNIRYIDWRVLGSESDQTVATDLAGDFEMPFDGTIVSIGAYFDTAGTTGTATIDVNLNGTTIMTTNKISVETGEKSSRDATTQPALTTTAITAGDIFTVDQDAIQTGTAGKGLTVRIGVRQS